MPIFFFEINAKFPNANCVISEKKIFATTTKDDKSIDPSQLIDDPNVFFIFF